MRRDAGARRIHGVATSMPVKIVKIYPSKRCEILNEACGGRVLGHTQILRCTLKNENTSMCSHTEHT